MSFLLVPLGMAVAVAVISYLPFFLAMRRAPAPTPSAALLLRGMARSVADLPLVLAFFPLGPWFRRRWRPHPPSRASMPPPACGGSPPALPPVLLLHGLYHNVTAWILYRHWLRSAGFTRVYCHGYSSWRTSFGLLVDGLDAAVRDLLAAFPGEKPLLMGHSLGGLLIRGWLADAAHQPLVAGAVTLGTPHQGSCLARLGVGRLARSLVFRGALIRTLEATEAPAEVPCAALYSPLDNMVLPQEGLYVTTPGWTVRASPAVSHIGMLRDRDTARMAVAILCAQADRGTRREPGCAPAGAGAEHAAPPMARSAPLSAGNR